MKRSEKGISRRGFLEATSRAAILAAGGAAVGRVGTSAQAAASNPFAYDVDHFAQTDPKLVAYELVTRFPTGVTEPRRISLGSDERVYVAGKNGLTVLDATGTRTLEIPLSSPARCVAVADDGTLYAGVRDHVEVFDRTGQALKAWESPGKKTWFTGLAVGESDVFVADSANRVILRYDRAGKLVARIGEKNKERNVPGLIVPSPYLDVALARDGLLRVNNPGRHRVEVYTTSGELEMSWGKPSAAIAGFCGCCNPISVTTLPEGGCVTCEKGLPRAKVYSAGGAFESVIAGPESFPENAKAGSGHGVSDGTMGGLHAAVSAQGRVFVLDLVTAQVLVMKKKA
jgi:hypothetical protein